MRLSVVWDMLHKIREPGRESEITAIDRAIALVEAALVACDEHELIFVGIDLSAALDKLHALKTQLTAR